MFRYYFDLAVRSLRRNPVLTGLMIMAIGFGVAASMTTYSVFRAVSGDPIPWKSDKLFVPQLDIWGKDFRKEPDIGSAALGYADAMALMRYGHARHRSVMYALGLSVIPSDASMKPELVYGHAVSSGFFPMLDVPFRYGSGWSQADDDARADVAVISAKLNQRLFGGSDSVGRQVRLGKRMYRVVGVMNGWHPRPKFYDVAEVNAFGPSDQVFVPFNTAISEQLPNEGNTNCRQIPPAGFAGMMHSDCVWIGMMVQLDSPAAIAGYRRFVANYAQQQERAGRFRAPAKGRLFGLMSWLDIEHVTPPDTKVSLLIALGLLVVCIVNTVGLMLSKFLRRSGEIGVRRALGATRTDIGLQFVMEAAVVGLAGGVFGLILTGLGVFGIGLVFDHDIARLAHLDPSLLALTLLLAIVSTVLAGLYPTLRATYVRPAMQLKTQ